MSAKGGHSVATWRYNVKVILCSYKGTLQAMLRVLNQYDALKYG